MYFKNLKYCIIILSLFVGMNCQANMASPYSEGTRVASAISSKDLQVVNEKISVTLDKNFEFALFKISYTIKTEKTGKQIPLLFVAENFADNFIVLVDGKAVQLQNIPTPYFNEIFNQFDIDSSKSVNINWGISHQFSYKLSDLKYFEVDIEKGEHVIQVQYKARVWVDYSDVIIKKSFPYVLNPAKHWQSFGKLEIIIDGSALPGTFVTNLDDAEKKPYSKIKTLQFDSIPADYLDITYQYDVSTLAKALLSITPLGIAIIIGIIMVIFHCIWMYRYRKVHLYQRKYLPIYIGSPLLPFLFLLCWYCSYEIIDYLLGEAASRNNGYFFLLFFFYPILLIVYIGFCFGIDYWIKNRLHKKIKLSILK